MASIDLSRETAEEYYKRCYKGYYERYYERVMRLCPKEPGDISLWPGLTVLQKFFEKEHQCTSPPEISIAHIPGPEEHATDFSIMSPEHHWDILEKLPSLADASPSSQLIIVENICPTTLAVLGVTYDIDPQFFAEHVNILSWYKMYERVPERLPSLPSTRKGEDFLALRYIETRQIDMTDDASVYASSILWPDPKKTRIGHSAGKLEPVSGLGVAFSRMAFTRQTVSVWCQKKTSGNGWISIMLLDPPFRLAGKHRSVGLSEYRNPSLRPKGDGEVYHREIRHSFRRAFCHLLEQRCTTDMYYLRTCATDIFLVLYEGYRVIASEWLVVNEYVKRELANIERQLEKQESTFQELEQHLRELYRIRRRCNKDRELVTEAATQCKNRGQALWPSSSPRPHHHHHCPGPAPLPTLAEKHARNLEEDLQYVLDNMSISISRVEKTITLLNGLVTISEGRQGLQENRGIAFLTLVATIFLPCGTVAAVLGIQTQYGPGAAGFWMLWAVALPLTALVVLIPYLYPVASAALRRLRARYAPVNPKLAASAAASAAVSAAATSEGLVGQPLEELSKMNTMEQLRSMSIYQKV